MSINASNSGGNSGCGGGSSSGCNSGGGSGPCGACKFLRRKCVPGCIFAPYFDSEQGATHFAAVHKVFGASNVSKMLQNIPVHKRLDAVITICYEAQARLRDPVYGCVAHIFALQQQVVSLQTELSYLQGHLATMEIPHPPPPPPPQAAVAPPSFSVSSLPSASTTSVLTTYDLSSLFDPMPQAPWATQQRSIDPRQYVGSSPSLAGGSGSGGNGNGGGGDLHSLARELLHGRGPSTAPIACSNASSAPLSK